MSRRYAQSLQNPLKWMARSPCRRLPNTLPAVGAISKPNFHSADQSASQRMTRPSPPGAEPGTAIKGGIHGNKLFSQANSSLWISYYWFRLQCRPERRGKWIVAGSGCPVEEEEAGEDISPCPRPSTTPSPLQRDHPAAHFKVNRQACGASV